MKKFNNYVFLTICEETFKLFKTTYFSTYRNYCKTLYLSLESNNLTAREKSNIVHLFDSLNLIYGLTDSESLFYIKKYLNCDMLHEFELYIRDMQEFFPEIFNK